MAVGFGFSVSDLIAALKIIKDSVDAIDEKKGASADYKALEAEIGSLQDGLEAVEEFQSNHDLSEKQNSAIDRTLHACQMSIEDFFASTAKYQPHLRTNTSGFASTYRKIKWVLCKAGDVAKFRAQLGRHASSINMLLIAFQAKKGLAAQETGPNLVINAWRNDDSSVTEMLKGLSIEQRQFFIIVMQQNKQLMQGMDDLRCMLQTQAAIPPQVMLQQPVILLDPFAKTAPFHLEFIDSPECFLAVLKVRFSKAGVTREGLSKLDNRDFVIQDTRRRRPIDLKQNWGAVFRPGQNVDMSMVFHRFACPPSTCPACLEANGDDDEQVYW